MLCLAATNRFSPFVFSRSGSLSDRRFVFNSLGKHNALETAACAFVCELVHSVNLRSDFTLRLYSLTFSTSAKYLFNYPNGYI